MFQVSQDGLHCTQLPIKLQKVGFRERSDPGKLSSSRPRPMIGKANKVAVWIQKNTVQALLDTGSMVSTMAVSLQTSLGLQILELDQMLTVEGSGSYSLPYLSYVEVDLFIKGMEEPTQKVVMLVVPDTTYHQWVLVLIGTNILRNLKQVVDGDPVWRIALASIAKHQAIVNTSESLGFLKTTKSVVIPP